MSELSKLRWHCRRGIKELDIILEKYLAQSYPSADQNEQKAFRELLNLEDPLLFAMLLDHEQPVDPAQIELLHKLKHLFSRT